MKFAIPAGLWQALRSEWTHSWWLPNVFLLGTFFQNSSKPLYTLWYLDVLAANLILLAVISWVRYFVRRRGSAESSGQAFLMAFAWVIVGLAVAATQVISGWWDGQVGIDSVAPFKWFWMMALGVLITQANSRSQKWGITALLPVLATSAYMMIPPLTPGYVDVFFCLAVGLMVWVERIPIPRLLHRPLVVIASSTLFIYIFNHAVITIAMPKLHLPASVPLEVIMVVACGIVGQLVWNRVTGMAWHLNQRLLGAASSRALATGTHVDIHSERGS